MSYSRSEAEILVDKIKVFILYMPDHELVKWVLVSLNRIIDGEYFRILNKSYSEWIMAAFRSDPPLLEQAGGVGEVPCSMQPDRYIESVQ